MAVGSAGWGVPAAVEGELANPTLLEAVRRQIEFYFSTANLVGDEHLRSLMDEDGFVPLVTVAAFKRISSMTRDLRTVLVALRGTEVLDVFLDRPEDMTSARIRSREHWQRWVRSRTASASATAPSSP